jgi:hypothetical protein
MDKELIRGLDQVLLFASHSMVVYNLLPPVLVRAEREVGTFDVFLVNSLGT